MTPTCVAPRHVDAPRDFLFYLFFLRTSSARGGGGGGGGGALPEFFWFFFPCSADHERDWPPCKVVFLGLATNALNVRNNNNNLSGKLLWADPVQSMREWLCSRKCFSLKKIKSPRRLKSSIRTPDRGFHFIFVFHTYYGGIITGF